MATIQRPRESNDTTQGTPETDGPEAGGFSYRKLMLIALILSASVYVGGLTSRWHFQRDSAIYLGLARSLLQDGSYEFNCEKHTKYPPGLPVILAGVAAVFGMPETLSSSFLPFNLLMVLFGLGSIGIFYLLLRELNLPPPVFAAAFVFFAFSRTLYYLSHQIMTDVPFTFFALLTLWLGMLFLRSEGRRAWLTGGGATVMTIVASSIRPVGPLLLVAITAGMWLRRGSAKRWRRNAIRTVLMWVALIVPLWLYSLWTHGVGDTSRGAHYFRGKITWNRVEVFFETIIEKFPAHFGGLSDTLLGTNSGPQIGMMLAAIMLIGLVRLVRRGERIGSIFAILLAAVIVAGSWSLSRRYLLPALPVMYIWLAMGGYTIGTWLERRGRFWTPRRLRVLALLCCAIVFFTNLARITVVVAGNRARDFYVATEEPRVNDYAVICPWLRENAGPDDALLTYEMSTIHYFGDLRTVQMPYSTEKRSVGWLIEEIMNEGISFILYDPHKEESILVVELMEKRHPEILDEVLTAGETKLLRVDREAFDELIERLRRREREKRKEQKTAGDSG